MPTALIEITNHSFERMELVEAPQGTGRRCSGRMPAGVTSLWLAFLLLSGSIFGGQADKPEPRFDCDGGCDLSVRPVCGDDGQWYQNECLAFCAEVQIAQNNTLCQGTAMPFTDNRPGPLGAESSSPAAHVNNTLLNQFLAEGLRYLGRVRLVHDLDIPSLAGPGASDPEKDADGNWRVRAVRCTAEGDVYAGSMVIPGEVAETLGQVPTGLPVAKGFGELFAGASFAGGSSTPAPADSPAAAPTPAPLPPSPSPTPVAAGNSTAAAAGSADDADGDDDGDDVDDDGLDIGIASLPHPPQYTATSVKSPKSLFRLPRWNLFGRRLAGIVGSDDRTSCPLSQYPYTAIGQIEVTDSSGMFICTGTLIAPNKVLTAGHCVWNTRRSSFYSNLNFAPGRYRSGDRFVNPWGVVRWKSVTVFDAFKRNPNTWDVAVVTLQKSVGSLAGTMGVASGCLKNQKLFIGGYPQDKSQGTCEAATCMQPYLNCNAPLNAHYCDTVSGMSGSPLWDSNFKVRMVHVAGIGGRQENRATTLTQFLVNSVSRW